MSKDFSDCSVALIYDHLITPHGGAEMVLQAILEAFPQAELWTTIQDTNKTEWLKRTKVHTSGLQEYFWITKKREVLDVLTPITLEQFDLSGFDIIISVTSSAAKGVLTLPHQLHICYLLTPTRYLYHSAETLLNDHPVLSLPIVRSIAQLPLHYLRWWDQVAIWRPDKIITISKQVSLRCEKYYQRTADAVLYPPVELQNKTKFSNTNPAVMENNTDSLTPDFFLVITRLMPYKRVDLAISACLELQLPLIIVGSGSELSNLKKLASTAGYTRSQGETVQTAYTQGILNKKLIFFMNSCAEAEKSQLLQGCKAGILPGIEDFGITPLEANAYGKPVVISAQSGVAEVITDGIHGIHFAKQTIEAVVKALKKLDQIKFSAVKLKANAARFSREEFVRKFHNSCFAFYKEHSTIKA